LDSAANRSTLCGVPVVLGPLVGLALGAALALWWRTEAISEAAPVGWSRLYVAALLGALVYAPTCALFMIVAGDWALFYLTDSKSVPSAVLLVVALVDGAVVAGGFGAGYVAARRRALRVLVALVTGPLVVSALIAFAFASKLRIEGTAQQVASGFGLRPVAGGPLGMSILWAWATMMLALFVATRSLDQPGHSSPENDRRDAR